MIVSMRFPVAMALGLSLLQPMTGRTAELSTAKSPSANRERNLNQQVADRIATQLRDSSLLRRYDVDISFRDGVAELTGSVANAEQRDRVMKLVRDVPGVQRVVDHLSVTGAIVPVQAAGPPAGLQPVPSSPALPPVNTAPSGQSAPPPASAAHPPEAMPVFQAPGAAPHALNPPRMPPYAWPSYAPYNNYSRVAYPLAYPHNAFPFIGPVYPFPKVPLGWRSVRLQWDDGFWWFSKTATRWDWWKLRYY